MPRIYDYAYEKARKRVLDGAQVCAICGRPLDRDAPPRSRWSPSADHLLPVSRTIGMDDATRRALACDPQNLRAVHLGCNSRRGARPDKPRHVSRSW